MNKAIPLSLLIIFVLLSSNIITPTLAYEEVTLTSSNENLFIFCNTAIYNNSIMYTFFREDGVLKYKYADINNITSWSNSYSTGLSRQYDVTHAEIIVGNKVYLFYSDSDYLLKYKIGTILSDRTISVGSTVYLVSSCRMAWGYGAFIVSQVEVGDKIYFTLSGGAVNDPRLMVGYKNNGSIANVTTVNAAQYKIKVAYNPLYNQIILYWGGDSTLYYMVYQDGQWSSKQLSLGVSGFSIYSSGAVVNGMFLVAIGQTNVISIVRMSEDGTFSIFQQLSGYSNCYLISDNYDNAKLIAWNVGGKLKEYTYIKSTNSFNNIQEISTNNVHNAYYFFMPNIQKYAYLYLKSDSPYDIICITTDISTYISGISFDFTVAGRTEFANVTFYAECTKGFASVVLDFGVFETNIPGSFAYVKFLIESKEFISGEFARISIGIGVSYSPQDYFAQVGFNLYVNPPEEITHLSVSVNVYLSELTKLNINVIVIPPEIQPGEEEYYYINKGINIIPLLILLLLPTYIMYSYVGKTAVLPTFIGMTVIAYISNMMSLIPFFICLSIGVILLFYQFRSGGDG